MSDWPFKKDNFLYLFSWLPPQDMISLMFTNKRAHRYGIEWLQLKGRTWVPDVDEKWSIEKLRIAAACAFQKRKKIAVSDWNPVVVVDFSERCSWMLYQGSLSISLLGKDPHRSCKLSGKEEPETPSLTLFRSEQRTFAIALSFNRCFCVPEDQLKKIKLGTEVISYAVDDDQDARRIALMRETADNQAVVLWCSLEQILNGEKIPWETVKLTLDHPAALCHIDFADRDTLTIRYSKFVVWTYHLQTGVVDATQYIPAKEEPRFLTRALEQIHVPHPKAVRTWHDKDYHAYLSVRQNQAITLFKWEQQEDLDLEAAIECSANISWIEKLLENEQWFSEEGAARYEKLMNLATSVRRSDVVDLLASTAGFVDACQAGNYTMVCEMLKRKVMPLKRPTFRMPFVSYAELLDPLYNWPPWKGVKAAIANHHWNVVKAVLEALPSPKDKEVLEEITNQISAACEKGIQGNRQDYEKMLRKLPQALTPPQKRQKQN